MHHALQIREVLLNILGHCRPLGTSTSDLPALARTCVAFKEPALDLLWEELPNPSPLTRCLPEASRCQQISEYGGKCYSFSRSLTQVEWDILRSYTRRVLSIHAYHGVLDWESMGTFLNPPATEPLFPNLRHLWFGSANATDAKHFLCMPFPSLTSLSIGFDDKENPNVLRHSLESFYEFSPNIIKLFIQPDLGHDLVAFSSFFFRFISQWQNLQTVDYSPIVPDLDILGHLSCMPALTRLSLTLSFAMMDQITRSSAPFLISNLHDLTLHSDFLDPISRFLFRTRLPAITDFTAVVETYAPKEDVPFFFISVQTSDIGHDIQSLSLTQRFSDSAGVSALGFEDLQPCMAFTNLRRIEVDLDWRVGLKSSELLTLASAWPHLQCLLINPWWGWNTSHGYLLDGFTPGGITPNGLLQLLQICPSLSRIALAMDTRGYIECPPSPPGLGFTLPHEFSIDVVDSIIDEESVPAIAAFFASIASRPKFSFRAWESYNLKKTSPYKDRWNGVYGLANETIRQRC